MDKVRVSILGSTGLVGQWMVKLLANHPFIEVAALSASPGKVGQRYGDVVKWFIEGDVPEYARGIRLVSTDPVDHRNVDVVLSALPNEVAEPVEARLLEAGLNVISNASPRRMDPNVPLINPEVNWQHLEVLRDFKGPWLVKNPNCTSAIITLAIKPLADHIRELYITTLQAVSGAGYLGLSYLAIEGNVIPFIKGEEDKIAAESNKMLGAMGKGEFTPWGRPVRVTSIRVPVRYGHMASIFAVMDREYDVGEVKQALSGFRSLPQEANLPTAPPRPIIVLDRQDAPQPAKDLDHMAVTVGRLSTSGRVVRMVALGDNLVRGAAGITVLTLEVMKAIKLL
ncbi:MAG: aspartate-semialdehyde dehydrogenase [Caldivirga sp.]